MEQSQTTIPAVETAGLTLSQTSLSSLSRGEAWSCPRDRSVLHTQLVLFPAGREDASGSFICADHRIVRAQTEAGSLLARTSRKGYGTTDRPSWQMTDVCDLPYIQM